MVLILGQGKIIKISIIFCIRKEKTNNSLVQFQHCTLRTRPKFLFLFKEKVSDGGI